MQVINTYPQIQKYFFAGQFDIYTWRNYANEISPQLASLCENDSADYHFDKQVLPILNAALNDKQKMHITNESFIRVTNQLSNNISRLFDKEIELDIILYLGLCNGAGWATSLDNKNVILLGIEKIIELNWYDEKSMRGLIFHEIGHIWHNTYGKMLPYAASNERQIQQLYQEGVAMVCEQILSRDDMHFHQDENGWLAWCQKHEKELKKEYLNRIHALQSTQDFFGDWCKFQGYSDTGYYLGCQFIKYLEKKYKLVQIANLPSDVLLREFEIFAKV